MLDLASEDLCLAQHHTGIKLQSEDLNPGPPIYKCRAVFTMPHCHAPLQVTLRHKDSHFTASIEGGMISTLGPN